MEVMPINAIAYRDDSIARPGYMIIRELPPRLRELRPFKERTAEHSLELLARGLTRNVAEDLLNSPFRDLAVQKTKITTALILRQIERTRSTLKSQLDSIQELKFLEREELERVLRNGPYRGFGYSAEFKNRLAALTREERERLSDYELTVQKLQRELWVVLHDLISGFDSSDNLLTIQGRGLQSPLLLDRAR